MSKLFSSRLGWPGKGVKKTTRLHVNNLHAEVGDSELSMLFDKFAPVRATVKRHRVTGESRCFGFVDFRDTQSSEDAIKAMDDYLYMGRRLRINYANPSIELTNGQSFDQRSRPSRRYYEREMENDAESDVLQHEPADPLTRSVSRSPIPPRSPSPTTSTEPQPATASPKTADTIGQFYLMVAIDPTKNIDMKTACLALLEQLNKQTDV